MNTENTSVQGLEDEVTPPVVEEKSLRDELSAAVEQAEARARDEQGRFTQAEKDAASAKVGQQVAAEQGTPVQSDQNAQAAATGPAYPNSWKAEHKAKWDALPVDVRQYITEREQQIHQGMTRADDDRTFGKSMKDVVSPYMAVIQAEGSNPHEAVKSLLNTAYVLRTAQPAQKVELFANLMQQYSIHPQDLFNRLQGGAPRIDPQVSALQQRLDQIEQERQAEIQSRQQTEIQEAHGTIDAFASQPGHEHFDKVRFVMGVFLRDGVAKDMEDAYQRAVYADPDLRSTMLAANSQSEQAKRVADAQAKAEAARRAGSSVSGSPGTASPAAAKNERSLREELEAAFQSASNG